ncbi:hypothetical protein, unknown function [Leishmania tarentolae]|uniref:Uncharacterized protein n=1 Tax=Leishmania tarentolae TaxID=5689 RepID=A0A640KL24_LEITA|nr:hypothetical protein, unknown function [Leishmania tarentolae]
MDDSVEKQEEGRCLNAMERPVSVKVPLPNLLDTKMEALRLNPSFFVTCFSTLLTAVLLGACFIIVGVPPLFIAVRRGRCIYVAVMIPLLTVIGTVLSYYVMQHPQRMLNAALAQVVEEVQHHAIYLRTAVDYVETELETRQATLGVAEKDEPVCARSLLVTPEESALQRFSRISVPGGAATRLPATLPTVSGRGLLHGIDQLQEDQDMVVATVHVGKEWQWLMGLLGKLNLRSLTGQTNTFSHHQDTAVRALVMSVARVERMILSLYFSSFVLNPANAAAPCPLSDLTVSTGIAGCSSGFGNDVGGNSGSAHGRTAASMRQPSAPIMKSVKLHPSHTPGHGLRGSFGENAFTHLRERLNESRDHAESSGAGEELTSQLTSLNMKDFSFERVKVPQFRALLSGRTGSREHQKVEAHEPEGPSAFKVAAPASAPVKRVLHLDTDAQLTDEKAEMPDDTSVTVHSFANTNKADDAGGQDGCSGDSPPRAVIDGCCSAGAAPSSSPAHATTACVQNSSIPAADKAAEKAFVGVQTGERGAVLSQGLSISAQHPARELSSGRRSTLSVMGSCTAAPHTDENGTGPSPMSSAVSKPRLVRPTRSRQPRSTVAAYPALTLHRGARFMGDDSDVFVTVLIHVEKGNSVCGSRLYAARAHTRYNTAANKHYFFNEPDSSVARSCGFNPFTVFYVSKHKGQRERLTIFEQNLLEFVYCCPEEQSEMDSVSHPCPTDGPSPAVGSPGHSSGDTVAAAGTTQEGSSTASFVHETASPPSSTPHHPSSMVLAEQHMDSFIVAMQVLKDRPMRLAFLPVALAPAKPRDTSLTHKYGTVQPFKTAHAMDLMTHSKELRPTGGGSISNTPSISEMMMPASCRPRSDSLPASGVSGAEVSTREALLRAPSPATLPVLECVIDGVLCILTEIEITVCSSLKRPSKVLLIGVSLEDVSEKGSECGVRSMGEDTEVSENSRGGNTGSRNLEDTGEKQPNDLRSPPRQQANNDAEVIQQGIQSSMVTPRGQSLLRDVGSRSLASLSAHEKGAACTLGREFREVIYLA